MSYKISISVLRLGKSTAPKDNDTKFGRSTRERTHIEEMAFSFSLLRSSLCVASQATQRLEKDVSQENTQLQNCSTPPSHAKIRRHTLLRTGALLVAASFTTENMTSLGANAQEKDPAVGEDEGDNSVFGAIQSLLDPNEKTKSGKILPKAYLKSAREVVKTLRESLQEDSKDISKFRRTADAAKESIREYLNSWRGQSSVSAEESYIALEKAIRSLAGFYSKAGPFATMPDDIKSNILSDLQTADSFL